MGAIQPEVLVLAEMRWDLLLILMLWKEFQPFTTTAKSNGLFKKDSENSTDIQSKYSAAHSRFISEEIEIFLRRDHDTSASTVMQLNLVESQYHLTFLTLKPPLTLT